MKSIKYWHVKLFQYIGTGMVAGKLEKLIHKGYSTSKPRLNYHENSVIELFTAPDQLETKTIRTYGIDSMVCTPVYEEEQKKLEPNKHLLKSEFFTIEFQIPNADDLNKIFAEVCEDVFPLDPTTDVFRVVFDEMLKRVHASIIASITAHPAFLHNPNAMHGKRITPVEKI